MIRHDVAQRSPEWAALRAGKVTGSCANALLKVRQRGSGELAIRRELRERLIVERLTGMAVEDIPYKGKDLQHGIDTEPQAAIEYEVVTGEMVSHCGFLQHDELAAGCSPDGYVGEFDGILEVKCPSSAQHLDYLNAKVIPEEYYGQLVHSLWITGAKWADFVSFDPRMKAPHLRLFTVRLLRNETEITAYELAVRLLLSEVDRAVAALVPETPTPEPENADAF